MKTTLLLTLAALVFLIAGCTESQGGAVQQTPEPEVKQPGEGGGNIVGDLKPDE